MNDRCDSRFGKLLDRHARSFCPNATLKLPETLWRKKGIWKLLLVSIQQLLDSADYPVISNYCLCMPQFARDLSVSTQHKRLVIPDGQTVILRKFFSYFKHIPSLSVDQTPIAGRLTIDLKIFSKSTVLVRGKRTLHSNKRAKKGAPISK